MKLFLVTFFILSQTFHSYSQQNQWESYIPNKTIYDCLVDENNLYAITFNGLVEYNLSTKSLNYYQRSNPSVPFFFPSKISKDKLGNIYYCTSTSLVKYDGEQFSEYPFTQKDYIYGNELVVDDSNIVWIASDWGLIKFKNEVFEIFIPDSTGYYENKFSSIALSPDGSIWVSTGQYIAKYNNNSWTIFWDLTITNFWTSCLYFDKNNTLWAGGLQGYYTYDGNNWTHFNKSNTSLIQEDVEVISSDVFGNMWFGTRQGVSVYDGSNWTSYSNHNSPLPNLWITSIFPTEDGSVFIATQNGLVKFFNNQWEDFSFSHYNFSFEQIHEVAVETNGKLWIGNGLNYGQQVGFAIYPDQLLFFDEDSFSLKELDQNFWWITDIYIDRDNNKWIGTSGGLYKVSEDTVSNYFTYNSEIPSYYILSITQDVFDNIWIGTIDGLAKLSDNKWTTFDTLNSGLPGNAVYEVKIDKNHNVWAATEDGLAKFNGSTWSIYSTKNSDIKENFVHHFSIDNNNNIWICNSYGIHHFNGVSWQNYNDQNSILPTNFVNVIKVDRENNKWIGLYYGGLVKIDSKGNWVMFNQENSPLLSNNIYSFFIDENNNKWIGTEAGLNVFNEGGINTTYIVQPRELPKHFYLSQNFPNPFNSSSVIEYNVLIEGHVTIKVYDILGREVKTLLDEVKSYGNYSVEFNATGLTSGIYIYHMQIGGFSSTKKAILLK